MHLSLPKTKLIVGLRVPRIEDILGILKPPTGFPSREDLLDASGHFGLTGLVHGSLQILIFSSRRGSSPPSPVGCL